MPGIETSTGLTGKVMGLGLAAKLGLVTSLAAAAVAGAGAVGALPAAATDAVRHAVEAVTPGGSDAPDKENFGSRVSADATGESDGQPGVDGQQISEEAPGAAHRPDSAAPEEAPGQSGVTGLARANQTPAADHAPDAAPSVAPTPDDAGQSADHRPATVPSTVPEPGGPPADHGAGGDTAGD